MGQLVKEKVNSKYKSRRSLIQNMLGFDLFLKNVYEHKPTFCTYFTNHVAGMMHRFWYDYFPDDFEIAPRMQSDFKKQSIIKALDIADNQIKVLLEFAKNNDYNIWIASSMGQNFIKTEVHNKKIFLEEPKRFLRTLDLDSSNYNFLPSMYPDINIEGDIA